MGTHSLEVKILQVGDVLRSIRVLVSVGVLLLDGLIFLNLHFDISTAELLHLTANVALTESLCLGCYHIREVLGPHPVEGEY